MTSVLHYLTAYLWGSTTGPVIVAALNHRHHWRRLTTAEPSHPTGCRPQHHPTEQPQRRTRAPRRDACPPHHMRGETFDEQQHPRTAVATPNSHPIFSKTGHS